MMPYEHRKLTPKKLDGGLEITKTASSMVITREPSKADIKYAKDYKKRYRMEYSGSARPIAASVSFNALTGCCSGTMLSRLNFPNGRQGKKTTLAKRAELLKIMMGYFSSRAILLYVGRSDNATNATTFRKAGWKRSRGPVGRYSPYNYTLDTYTVDPRNPKRKLPTLNKRKKVVSRAEPVIIYTGWRKYFGFSFSNVKRRIGGLRR